MKRSYPLSVVTSRLGVCSETFIKQHIYGILQGRTSAIARYKERERACWDAPGPVLLRGTSLTYKLGRFARNSVGRFDSQNRFGTRMSSVWHRKVRQFLLDNGTRVVLGEYLDVSHEYIEILNGLKIPFFVHAHGYDVSRSLRSPLWCARYREYNGIDGVVTMSEASRKRLVDVGIRPEKVFVVPYGITIQERYPRRTGGGDRKEVKVLAVGRMVPKKGPLLLLEAVRLAMNRHDHIYLDLVGDGPLLNAVRSYVESRGLKDRVCIHGARSNEEVRDRMKEADVFAQHSLVDPDTGDEEGLPVTILEAMAAGLPIVATRHAGIPEEVIEGETGILVDETDVEAMAEGLIELAESPETRQEFGYNGWKRARDKFSVERECETLRELLGLTG